MDIQREFEEVSMHAQASQRKKESQQGSTMVGGDGFLNKEE